MNSKTFDSRPTILVVEDSLDDETLTMRALNSLRPQPSVEVARDGEEALGALNARFYNCNPDLILLDLRLPKVNGLELLRAIRSTRQTRYIKVVVFTSSDEAVDMESCQSAGVLAYVRKPVGFDEYLAAVRKIAVQYLPRNAIETDLIPSSICSL